MKCYNYDQSVNCITYDIRQGAMAEWVAGLSFNREIHGSIPDTDS